MAAAVATPADGSGDGSFVEDFDLLTEEELMVCTTCVWFASVYHQRDNWAVLGAASCVCARVAGNVVLEPAAAVRAGQTCDRNGTRTTGLPWRTRSNPCTSTTFPLCWCR